jgi:hypothetical protein
MTTVKAARVMNNCGRASRRRGAAVVTVLVAVGVLGTLSMAMLGSVGSSFRLNKSIRDQVGAHYLAEAGLAEAVDDLRRGGLGDLGSNQQRIGFGGGDYWVESEDLGDGLTSIVATGVQGRSVSRLELVLNASGDTLFSWGAFGDLGLTLDANAHVDSYNSSNGPYNPTNGSGNDKYDSAEGAVGANGSIMLDTNSLVFGDAVPGPVGSVILNGKSAVAGSTTPNTALVDLPPIDMPVITSSGDWSPTGNASLPAGDHAFDTFTLGSNATLTITGPARILSSNMLVLSNSKIIVDSTSGPVEFYVADDFVMSSNTTISAINGVPGDVGVYLETDNILDPDVTVDLDQVDFDSNAKLYGTVYAPNAAIDINSNFELFGSLVAKSVALDSNSYIHFDEALRNSGGGSNGVDFVRVAWRERSVPASEIQW